MNRRPMGVTVVAGFLFFATAVAWLVGFVLLFPGSALDWIWRLNPAGEAAFRAVGPLSGVFLLALGIATAAAGAGMLRGRRWAWWFAVALFAVNGCGDVASVFITRDWMRSSIGVAAAVTFLYMLLRPPARAYFQRG